VRRAALILLNDVRRHLKAPAVILIFIAIPLAMTALIGIIFAPKTEGSKLPPIPVLIVDNDKGLASKLLVSSFDVDQMKEMFQATVTEEADGRARMSKGKASAMVVIPKGFTLDLLEAKPVTLLVVKNPAEQFLPDIVEEFMATMAVMLSGVVQAFAEEVRGVRAMIDLPVGAMPWESLAPELGKAQKKIAAASKYLDPLLLRLKEEETQAAGARPRITASHLFSEILPGMAVMFLLFIVQTLMRDLLTDREDGKLRRMATTPLRPLELIGARLAGGWFMGLAVLLVMAGVGALAFRVRVGPLGLYLLLAAVISFWTAAFFALFHALVRNRNQAGALGAPIILAFSIFGGSMINVEAMPKAFRAIGIVTPNRWYIDGAALVREGRFPAASLVVLLVSGLVLLALAVPALRRRTTE